MNDENKPVTDATPTDAVSEPTAQSSEKQYPLRKPLVLFPDFKLYQVARPVFHEMIQLQETIQTPWGKVTLHELVDAMIETMLAENGVGLAAIQVGVPLSLFVMEGAMIDDEPIVVINPTWRSEDEKVLLDEGCLSFPAVVEPVSRYATIHAGWTDLSGAWNEQELEGILARVFQHECEHLHGELFTQHLSSVKRNKIYVRSKQRARLTKRINRVLKGAGNDPQALLNSGLIKMPARKGFRK